MYEECMKKHTETISKMLIVTYEHELPDVMVVVELVVVGLEVKLESSIDHQVQWYW